MRKHISLIVLALVATGGFVAAWRSEVARRDAVQKVAALETRLANPNAPAPAPEPSTEPEHSAEPAKETKIIRVPSGVDPAEYLKTIDELRHRLAQLQKDLSEAKDATARAESQQATLNTELEKVQAQQTDLRDDLQAARRAIAAMEAELKSKNDRITRAEAAEKVTAERLAKAEAAANKVNGAVKEMEDINRRRENYLTNILRRYRDVTDLYRNFTLSAQNRENQAPGFQAGDLSRIQSTIQQAEDDLRQLQALNVRAAQLARRN